MRNLSLFFLIVVLSACSANKDNKGNYDLISKRLDVLENEISRIKLQIENTDSIATENKENELFRRILVLEDKLADYHKQVSETKDVQLTSPEVTSAPVLSNTFAMNQVVNDESTYEATRKIYESGKFNLAIEKFRELVITYPESKYVPNAYYWMGEAYYSMRDFSSAIDEFQKVIDYFPQTSKAPDSMLKLGKCYVEMDMKAQALTELRRIEKMYPDYEKIEIVKKLITNLTE